jgi:formate dehydrogenase major subunit
MTNSIGEIAGSNVLMVIGSNTTEAHPVIAYYIKQAIKKNGAKLLVAEPRKIDLTRYCDIHISQQPGTDVALLNGMMNVIIAEGLQDQKFIDERCENYEELKKAVEKYTPEYVEKITGIPAEELKEAAILYGSADKATIFFAMGITQHISGTDNVKSVANLAMLTGNVGRESTGVDPLRGQNNVQGACDLGGLPNVFTGYAKVTDEKAVARFSEAWGAKLDNKNGLTVTEMMSGAESGEVKALYIMGENPMVSDPNLHHVEQSLNNLDFLVVQDIFLTETAQLADVVLPAACSYEKDGTYTNTERRVQKVNRAINPPGESKDDWWIVAEISRRMGYEMNYSSAEDIAREISEVTPSYGGISYDRLGGDGLQWPCPTADHPGTKFLHGETFARGKGLFHAVEFIPPAEETDKDYPIILTTGRMLEHYHTGSMTRRVKELDAIAPQGFVEINPEDAAGLGVVDKDRIKVISRRGEIKLVILITKRVKPGTVFMPFHFVEAAANQLTNDAIDPIAKIPELKVCAVKLEKA